MKVEHPDGKTLVFLQKGTGFMGSFNDCWVTIGYPGGNFQLLVDEDEWPAFFKMVLEIDEAMKQHLDARSNLTATQALQK